MGISEVNALTDYINIYFLPKECCILHRPRWRDAFIKYLREERKTQREAINNTIWSACWHKQSCINICHLLSTSHLHIINSLSEHGYVHLTMLESLPMGPLPRMGHCTPIRQIPTPNILPPSGPYASSSCHLRNHMPSCATTYWAI